MSSAPGGAPSEAWVTALIEVEAPSPSDSSEHARDDPERAGTLTRRGTSDGIQRCNGDPGGRALQRAGETVRLDGVTIKPPAREQTRSAREEVGYAAFSRAFGLVGDDGETEPPRLVSIPKAEYDEMVQNAAKLPKLVGMMRQLPAVVTPEEEAEYQRFASQFGWE